MGDTFMGVLGPVPIGVYCADFLYACWYGVGWGTTVAREKSVAMAKRRGRASEEARRSAARSREPYQSNARTKTAEER